MARLLVVDDELGVQESLRMVFKGECEVDTAADVDEALRRIEVSPPNLILLDLVMPGRNGLELLAELRETGRPIPTIVLTATRTVATAVEAMKLGAIDYLTKPFDVDALRIRVRRTLEHCALVDELARLREEVRERNRLGPLLGRSDAMREVFRTLERVAPTPVTVLIAGESGTGKELAARAIHDLGPRREGPFVAVNCAALPDTLIESELFGHERGAFTDARERRIGKFEAASGGTLFLDEIGELPAAVQAKLLRALQERAIERLGGTTAIAVDVRVVAATHRDLAAEVAAGRFREDLYYRIHVFRIDLPPLRERREDIRLLARHFLARARERIGRGPTDFTPEALAALERHPWPGNVRELANAIEAGVVMAEGDRLRPEDLPPAVTESGRMDALREELRAGRLGYEEALRRFETDILREALERNGWNQTRTAEQLGITRRLLKLKMDRLGLGPG